MKIFTYIKSCFCPKYFQQKENDTAQTNKITTITETNLQLLNSMQNRNMQPLTKKTIQPHDPKKINLQTLENDNDSLQKQSNNPTSRTDSLTDPCSIGQLCEENNEQIEIKKTPNSTVQPFNSNKEKSYQTCMDQSYDTWRNNNWTTLDKSQDIKAYWNKHTTHRREQKTSEQQPWIANQLETSELFFDPPINDKKVN